MCAVSPRSGPVRDAAASEQPGARGQQRDAHARCNESDDGLHQPNILLHRAGREAGVAADGKHLGV